MGEVTQISEVIHDAAGDQAEIIFGSCTETALHGEIRVTVIATGFDRAITGETPARAPGVLQFPEKKRAVAGGGGGGIVSAGSGAGGAGPQLPAARPAPARPAAGASRSATGTPEVSDMEIPTFIRRQMD